MAMIFLLPGIMMVSGALFTTRGLETFLFSLSCPVPAVAGAMEGGWCFLQEMVFFAASVVSGFLVIMGLRICYVLWCREGG
jgi:hypothetical protein